MNRPTRPVGYPWRSVAWNGRAEPTGADEARAMRHRSSTTKGA